MAAYDGLHVELTCLHAASVEFAWDGREVCYQALPQEGELFVNGVLASLLAVWLK